MSRRKLIVISGPTASGKSDLAVKIAKKFNGQIISADSRQVYIGMNIGTGKVPRDKIFNYQQFSPELTAEGFSIFKQAQNSKAELSFMKAKGKKGSKKNVSSLVSSLTQQTKLSSASRRRRRDEVSSPSRRRRRDEVSSPSRRRRRDEVSSPIKIQKQPYFYKGIEHHLLDIASPKRKFTVAQYRRLALKAIDKILKKGKIPILCGGTGFYIQAIVEGLIFPEVKPDWTLRSELEQLETKQLFEKLKKLDPKRAKTIDKNNRRRLIRALEILIKTKKPIPSLKKDSFLYPVLMIGIKKEKKELSSLIKKRLLKRLEKGMVAEVKKLKKSGLSWKRLEEFGLEYRFVAQYLQKKIDYEQMVIAIQKESERFAKRQMTWFKKDKRIKWIKTYSQTEKLVKGFLSKPR